MFDRWLKPASTEPKIVVVEHSLLEGHLAPVVSALEFLLLEAEQRAQGDAARTHLRNLLGDLRAAVSK